MIDIYQENAWKYGNITVSKDMKVSETRFTTDAYMYIFGEWALGACGIYSLYFYIRGFCRQLDFQTAEEDDQYRLAYPSKWHRSAAAESYWMLKTVNLN